MNALGRHRRALAAAAALVVLVSLLLSRSSVPVSELVGIALERSESGITVREATLRRRPTTWLLDARADIELPPPIRAGLDSGVPLEFVLELSLREPRTFLPDRTVLDVTRRYGLVYYELTRHYRVRSFEGGTGRNYRSLPTALVGLGTLHDVPLGNGAGKPWRAPLHARLSLKLDDRALPLPLQSPLGATWRLASDPYAWTLRPGSAS